MNGVGRRGEREWDGQVRMEVVVVGGSSENGNRGLKWETRRCAASLQQAFDTRRETDAK